jgi:glyoxylase-like metal-dependent hydrolase (beta-lactamase superfamily II)
VSYRVGPIELVPLLDALGELGELEELYPDVSAEAWEPYRPLYPELFAESRWRVPSACYLVRSVGTSILVDTGLGPPGSAGWTLSREGELPRALEERGVGREEIDVVFLTHLHVDHLGWNTDADGEVFFPRARYLVHSDALAFARTRAELPHIRRCVEPLGDRFETLADETELAPGVVAFATPGHFPGHMSVRIRSGGAEALLLGDIAVHPAQLDRPEWGYLYDLDQPATVETRRSVIPALVGRDVLVACGHYPGGGVGRIVRRNGRTAWEAAAL